MAVALGAAFSFTTAAFATFLMCGFELVFGQLPVAVCVDLVEVLDESCRASAFDFFERELLVAVRVSVGKALAAFCLVCSALALAILVATIDGFFAA